MFRELSRTILNSYSLLTLRNKSYISSFLASVHLPLLLYPCVDLFENAFSLTRDIRLWKMCFDVDSSHWGLATETRYNVTRKKHKAKPVVIAPRASDQISMASLGSLFGSWTDFQTAKGNHDSCKKDACFIYGLKVCDENRWGDWFITSPKNRMTRYLWPGTKVSLLLLPPKWESYSDLAHTHVNDTRICCPEEFKQKRSVV